VSPFGRHRIQFDFTIDGRCYRPTLPWTPHEANLRQARELSSRIRAQIAAGTFSFTEQFPTYRLRKSLEDHPEQHNPAEALRSAHIGKKHRPVIGPFSIQDAEVLIAAIHRDWGEAQGNYDEFRFFTGLRPSEQIALVGFGFRSGERHAEREQSTRRGD